MGCKCGSQIVLCNLPVRFDTYVGCSHGCRYCFVQKKNGALAEVKKGDDAKSLKSFIEGKRTGECAPFDWNIPIHWGGMSDPFQPIEKRERRSLECLKLLAETQYPFVVSTKGKLICAPEYLELLEKCNCVVQISMVCSKYDKLELGAPTWEERLEMLRILSPRVKRTIVRIQPYMHEVLLDVLANIPRIKEAGAYGIVVEGMKFSKKKPGLVRIGGDSCYPIDLLRTDFEQIKATAHRHGLAFYCGENRLRSMGDDMTCCGTAGLEGFRPNTYNICMMINGKNPQPTERMKQIGTADAFKTLNQSAGSTQIISKQSLAGMMQRELSEKTEYYKLIFGKSDHE